MVALAVPTTNSIAQEHIVDTTWLRYFDPRAALAAVAAHIESLPGSRTAERHTMRAYTDGLNYFLEWMGGRLVTEDLMTAFIAHLLKQRGLKPSTVASKYLAPARLYLTKLAGQRVTGYTGSERDYIADCREHLRAAAAVKSPRAETTTNIAPLWAPQFHRLSLQQVNAVLRSIDRSTKLGLRDYALLHVAFATGLRLAELGRITLGAIQQQGDVYLITVRGKRSNIDPVPISAGAYTDIRAYVDAYNDGLEPDDPRLITPSSPLWQPLLHGDNYPMPGVNGYHPDKGLSTQGIRDVIGRRTEAALGEKIAAHDTRRTAAAIAYDAGMPLTDIQALLRHKDAAVTLRYVGTKPDFGARSLSTYVTFG
jgi:site-specific recombinase XerD